VVLLMLGRAPQRFRAVIGASSGCVATLAQKLAMRTPICVNDNIFAEANMT
jgi:hypothetical protein